MRNAARLLVCFLLFGASILVGCRTVQDIEPPEDVVLRYAPGKGALAVSIRERARSIEATFDDVDHLQVVLTLEGTSSTRVLSSAVLGTASASVEFVGLLPGDATLSLEVFDVSSRSIGTASATASIAASRITHVSVPLNLDGGVIVHPPVGG